MMKRLAFFRMSNSFSKLDSSMVHNPPFLEIIVCKSEMVFYIFKFSDLNVISSVDYELEEVTEHVSTFSILLSKNVS
jgi:hypothetical protein